MTTKWVIILALLVGSAVGAAAGVSGTLLATSQKVSDLDVFTLAHMHAAIDDLSVIHRTMRLDKQGKPLFVPECQDTIAMKLLIDLYDFRGPSVPILFQEKGTDDNKRSRVYGLQEIKNAATPETGKVDDGKIYDVPLVCEGVVISNRQSGPYRYGFLPVVEDGKIQRLYFAAKPVYSSFVSMVRTGLDNSSSILVGH